MGLGEVANFTYGTKTAFLIICTCKSQRGRCIQSYLHTLAYILSSAGQHITQIKYLHAANIKISSALIFFII